MNAIFTPRRGCRRADRQKKSNGFTLMELLIVIAIILVIVTIAVPQYTESSQPLSREMFDLEVIVECH